MKLPRPLAIVAGALLFLLLLVFFTILFIPAREIEGVIGRRMARAGCTFRAASFAKAFPLGIAARGVEVGSDRGVLLRVDTLSVRIEILPLLTGKVAIDCRAAIGKGEIRGEVAPRQGAGRLAVRGVRLEDIPFFQTVAGAQVRGELRADGSLAGNGKGELRLEVKGAEVRGVKIGETPLPDASYETVQGMLRTGGGRAALESFTLQGEGLYVRLKGEMPLAAPLPAAPLNLTLELMPKPDFLEKQKFVFLLLARYLASPGHYQVPIRGTLAKPAIQ